VDGLGKVEGSEMWEKRGWGRWKEGTYAQPDPPSVDASPILSSKNPSLSDARVHVLLLAGLY
jgi:hypothetical protein